MNVAPVTTAAVSDGSEPTVAATALGPRFADALELASNLHAGQVRKGTRIPYIAHLLAVTALVLENGGDEDAAIAALLHDAVEDAGGAATLDLIRDRFGDTVADVVEQCSDTDQTPKPPWRDRKQAYIASVPHKSERAVLVSVADKVHNARAIVDDFNDVGAEVWRRFNATPDEIVWYHRELTEAFRGRAPARLWRMLEQALSEMAMAAELPGPPPDRFKTVIGGYMGPSYEVVLQGGALTYTVHGHRYIEPVERTVTPTATQWGAFRRALDAIGVWEWAAEYPHSRVLDGAHWALQIVYSDRAIDTHGSNDYPGTATEAGRCSPEFERYIEAVRRLLGGREFF